MTYKLPKLDEKINKWKVLELMFEGEDGKKHYEIHTFWSYNDAVKFYEKNSGLKIEE